MRVFLIALLLLSGCGKSEERRAEEHNLCSKINAVFVHEVLSNDMLDVGVVGIRKDKTVLTMRFNALVILDAENGHIWAEAKTVGGSSKNFLHIHSLDDLRPITYKKPPPD